MIACNTEWAQRVGSASGSLLSSLPTSAACWAARALVERHVQACDPRRRVERAGIV